MVANLHPAPDALYAALFSALVELFCDMTPAEASAAARANPDTARGSGSGSLPGCAPMW